MKHLIRKHTISFKNAFEGLISAFTSQPNYNIHLTLSLLSILAGSYLRISSVEYLIIGLLITMGLVVETINTAIEETCDAIGTEIRPEIKLAKDTAAAAMLIFAIGATVLAAGIFIPRIIFLFS